MGLAQGVARSAFMVHCRDFAARMRLLRKITRFRRFTDLRSLHRGLSNDLVPLSLVLSRGSLSPSRYYFGEQITIRYLLVEILSARASRCGVGCAQPKLIRRARVRRDRVRALEVSVSLPELIFRTHAHRAYRF